MRIKVSLQHYLCLLNSLINLSFKETWFVFQKITQNIPGSSDGPLDLTVLNDIPLLSKLLFVSKVIVSSQKVQSMLLHLPFLEECIMKV